jgi:hypothetical protein
MDASRAQKIADVLKETRTLGKDIRKPVSGPAAAAASRASIEATSRLPTGSIGGTVMKYLLYFIATLLAIGLLVLAFDQWVTPIFKKLPASLPGIDKTQVFWTNTNSVYDITVGTPPPGVTPVATAPYVSSLVGRDTYAFTADILIENEFPQALTTGSERVFLVIGQSVSSPNIQLSVSNLINNLHVTANTVKGNQPTIETAEVENVPIHSSFRIGVVKTPKYMDVYLNGKLYKTRQLAGTSPPIASGNKVFAPSSTTLSTLSTGIKVLNFRAFSELPDPSEMLSRMNTLTPTASFSS